MKLTVRNNTHRLVLSVDEAFALQAALNKALQRMVAETMGLESQGAQCVMAEQVGNLTYSDNGQDYSSCLHIAVKTGHD